MAWAVLICAWALSGASNTVSYGSTLVFCIISDRNLRVNKKCKKMRLTKLFFGIVVLATSFSSCKKDNDKLIEGTWEMQSIYMDGYDAKVQYAGQDSMYCDSYQLAYNRSYEVEIIEWYITGGLFAHLESGKTFNPASDYCTSTNYDEGFSSLNFEGDYSISDEGKGDLLSVELDGGILEINILSLDKNKLSVEYMFEGIKVRMEMTKK